MRRIAIGGLLLLAACAPAPGVGNWSERDACRALPPSVMRQAFGPARMTPGTATVLRLDRVTMTSCVWRFAGRPGSVALLLRTSRSPDHADGAAAEAPGMTGPRASSADVPGLGRSAVWNAGTNLLMVVLDDHRLFTLAVARPAAGIDPKTAAITLARAIG